MGHMDIQSVLVELKRYNDNSVFGNSGIMYNGRYVITSLSTIMKFFTTSDLKELESAGPGLLPISSFRFLQDISISIHAKDEKSKRIRTYTAHFENIFQSSNIKQSAALIFRNWSFGSVKYHNTYLMSLIVVLKIDGAQNELKEDVRSWLNEMPKTIFSKGQNLKCISTAFGNTNFMNHLCQGIISNILGKDNCLIFSDMPLTPGSEGSPVFSVRGNSSQIAIGIVISSINWWKGESLNFTVIADLRSLFSEFLQQNNCCMINQKLQVSNTELLDTIESSLFQIYNGAIWGTAILIDREKGILITNAHVVDSASYHPMLHQRSKDIPCDVIFSCPLDNSIDIAILKTIEPLEKYCRSITYSKELVRCGDPVYSAGFPIFSKETNPGATVTKGHVSHVHPHMIKTTCSIHPGASGGAILNEKGELAAVIVCNARTTEPINMIYPRLNMSIPAKIIEPILTEYVANGDPTVFQRLSGMEAEIWNFSSKL